MGNSAADKLTYCALFDKSTNFGTEVDRHIMNKFGCGAIGAPWQPWRPFSKMAARRHQKVRYSFASEGFSECLLNVLNQNMPDSY